MTNKQLVFIENYLKCWNGTEAARIAGYKNPSVASSRLIRNDKVQAKIRERIGQLELSADAVLLRLAEQARNEGAQYLDQNGQVDMARIIRDGKQHLIKKVKVRTITDKNGNIIRHEEYEFYDAQQALIQLGRAMAMFTDRVEREDRKLMVWDIPPIDSQANKE